MTFLKGHNRRGKGWQERVPPDVPIGLCECGCGASTPLATKTYPGKRFYKGHPLPLVPGHRRALITDTVRRLSLEEACYLAGIVDGEGCIYIKPAGYRSVRVTVANTSIPLIDWLRQIGGGYVLMNGRKKAYSKKKHCFTWSVSSWRTVRDVLTQITPYLIVKRDKAEQALKLVHHWLTPSEQIRPRTSRSGPRQHRSKPRTRPSDGSQ